MRMDEYRDRIVVFENDFVRVVVEPCWEPGKDPQVFVGVELSGRIVSKLMNFIPIDSWIGVLDEYPPKAEVVKGALSKLLSEMKINISEERIEEIANEASAKAWAYKVSEVLRS